MNQNKVQTNFYQKKRNIKSNKNIKVYMDNPLNKKYPKKTINIILKRKKHNLLNPPKIGAYINPLKKEISNRISREKDPNNIPNKKIFENMVNYNTLDELNENKYLLERPKVNIRINSTKHNKNTISSEKNNNPIKYKIHKLKPKNLKFQENIAVSPSKSISKVNRNKINYAMFNSIQNSFDSSETNVSRKNRDYSSLNYYYNIIQEKNLKNLNNNIENIINGQFHTNDLNTTTKKYSFLNKNKNKKKIKNKSNKNIKLNKIKLYNKIIYKKKIQGIKNLSGTFSDFTTLEKDKDEDKKYNSKFIYDNNKKLDFLTNNKTCDLITYNYETPYKSGFLPTNIKGYQEMDSIKKNSSIFFPTFTYPEPEPKISIKKDYIRIENYNNNNLTIDNNNKSDTINFIDEIEHYYKLDYINKEKNKNSKNNYNSLLTSKKLYNCNTPKSSTMITINNKSKKNKNNMNYYIKKSYNNKLKKALINNISGEANKNIPKNINNKLNINHSLGYSNSITDYNTINTMNSSENKIENYFNNNDINDKKKQNMTIYEDYIRPNYFNSNNQKYFNNKNGILTPVGDINNSRPKKLKNVITSIQYRNINNTNLADTNIILSEYDYDGKLNIKVKKMNKSIEKVIRENSSQKDNNLFYIESPKISNDVLTYIKKNQGTHIPKIKKYNTINKL